MQNLLNSLLSKQRPMGLALLLFLLLSTVTVFAQTENTPSQYTFFTIELWPDYDRPELLVILNGGLAPDTSLPTTVTIPIPEDATINAVARVDSHNMLVDDLEFTISNGQLSFATSNLSYQVEYYQPYQKHNDARTVVFQWISPLPVQQFLMRVQEPFEATNFSLSEDVFQVQQNNDGLRYHLLPAQALTAGQETSLSINYTLPEGSLSSERVQSIVDTNVSDDNAAVGATTNNNGLFYALGTGLLLFSIFMISSGIRGRMQANRVSKPKRQHTNHCPSCSQPTFKNDKFCGSCGAKL